MKIFFREVKTFGMHKIPTEGGVIFVCGPHANQFLDPMLVFLSIARRPGFLAAEKSVKRRFIGWMIRQFNSIPVTRPQDNAIKGVGKVTIEGDVVTGQGTNFLEDFPKGSAILVMHEIVKVAQVKTSNLLILKGRSTSLDTTQPQSYKIVPQVNQDEMFQKVWGILQNGGCVGIFPEGGSHDQPQLLPLKFGVAIMALGAGDLHKVTVVPIGLNYFAPEKFRSKAFLDCGEPIVVPKELAVQFA